MSKFFAGGASDSDYSSSEEEDLYLSEQLHEESSESESASDASDNEGSDVEEGSGSEAGEGKSAPQQFMRNKFLKGQGSDSDDSDSDDDRGAIKSAKDKLLDEIAGFVKSFDSAVQTDDWVAAGAQFDKAFKSQERAMRQYSVVPVCIVKLLSTVDATIADARAKKLNPSNSKAVNVVNQRTKKLSKEYESRIAEYVKDPEAYDPEPPLVSELVQTQVEQGEEYNSANVFTILSTIVQARGKKKTDKGEQIEVLEKLLGVSDTAYKKLSVLLILVPIRFDLHSSPMPTEAWQAIEANIRSLFEILEANPEFIVIESAREPEELETPPAPGPGGARQIPGSVSSLVERLDDEHIKALQLIDPHTTEYIERLRSQTKLYDLVLRAQCHIERNLERIGAERSESLFRLLVRRLDHIYYKPSQAIIVTEQSAWASVPKGLESKITPPLESAPAAPAEYTTALVDSICKVLYDQPNTVFRSKAMLALIYHYALNDMYYQARDLMLMSHLQSTIHNAEPTVQVMFNRALVQVGLCAFRIGLFQDALTSLQELCASSRLKELLGQGIAKTFSSGAPDRSQILPFHMHINIELIECVYLTSSLLVEIPGKKKNVSKPFRRMLDFYDRQVFNGPSENTRDHIIQAAKALQLGDWRSATELLCSIRVWSLLNNSKEILEMLELKLKSEGLCVYLAVFGSSYESLGVDYLVEQFQLPQETVRSLISRQVVNEELHASFDASDDFVLFGAAADPSKLQLLGSQLADKTGVLADRNERLAGDGSDKKPLRKRAVA